jgi:hypothetical protein
LTPEDKKLQASYREKALTHLERSIASGYDDWAGIRANRDFDAIRVYPRFQKLLLRERK